MNDRVVLITGANSGIGLETAVALATAGATVVMAARNPAKGEAALAEVRRRSGRTDVELVGLDLASLASVRTCATEVLDRFDRLDVLVNNAGLVLNKREVTEDGFEQQFGVNHLGHFLLTSLLLDRLKAADAARIVHLSSDAHRFAFRGLDFGDLQSERGPYIGFYAYGKTKLANLLFSNELSRRLTGSGVTSNAVHPGVVATNFSREGDNGLFGELTQRLIRPFAKTQAQGAETTVHVASSPAVEGVSGLYFANSKPTAPSPHGRDAAAARRLWEESERLVGSS